MSELPAPKNRLVETINVIIDGLVLGIGEELIIKGAEAQSPWLSFPGISWVFKSWIGYLSHQVDNAIKHNIDNIVIRMQDDISKHAFDQVMAKLKAGGASDKDIDDAKKAVDDIVHRNHSV